MLKHSMGNLLSFIKTRKTEENALEILKGYNTVFIVDDSTSMEGTLWKQAKKATSELVQKAAQYDTDGIDLCFLNDKSKYDCLKSAAEVKSIFNKVSLTSKTPIGTRLETIMNAYLDLLGSENPDMIKPVNYIVITDGVPTDDPENYPENVIRAAAERLDKRNRPLTQVGIQFVQIGKSVWATDYLAKLDNELKGVRDMVDTTPYTGEEFTTEYLIKALLGGINRRVDKKGGKVLLEQS